MPSKEVCRELVQKYTQCLLFSASHTARGFQVYFNGPEAPDHARMMFLAYTLARVFVRFPEMALAREELLSRIDSIQSDASTPLARLYTSMYGMRARTLLREPIDDLMNDFLALDHAHLFEYPVTMYVLVSTGFENKKFLEHPFALSLHTHAITVLDFTLRDSRQSWNPFCFAEVSAWEGMVHPSLTTLARESMRTNFIKNATDVVTASGIAKCLEHFARVHDAETFLRGVEILTARSLEHYSFLDPRLQLYASVLFSEYPRDQRVCMDTAAHMIHSYLNIYDHLD